MAATTELLWVSGVADEDWHGMSLDASGGDSAGCPWFRLKQNFAEKFALLCATALTQCENASTLMLLVSGYFLNPPEYAMRIAWEESCLRSPSAHPVLSNFNVFGDRP